MGSGLCPLWTWEACTKVSTPPPSSTGCKPEFVHAIPRTVLTTMHALNTMISQEVCSRRERPSSLENYFLTFIAPCCVNTRSRNKKDRGRTIIYWTLSEPGPLLEPLQISVPSPLKNQNPGVSITGTMYHESICVPAACNESRTEDQF